MIKGVISDEEKLHFLQISHPENKNKIIFHLYEKTDQQWDNYHSREIITDHYQFLIELPNFIKSFEEKKVANKYKQRVIPLDTIEEGGTKKFLVHFIQIRTIFHR